MFIAALLGAALLGCPAPAHAYLDPGSGSYLLQFLIAGLLGAGVALKVYWGKFKSIFSPPARKKDSGSEGND